MSYVQVVDSRTNILLNNNGGQSTFSRRKTHNRLGNSAFAASDSYVPARNGFRVADPVPLAAPGNAAFVPARRTRALERVRRDTKSPTEENETNKQS